MAFKIGKIGTAAVVLLHVEHDPVNRKKWPDLRTLEVAELDNLLLAVTARVFAKCARRKKGVRWIFRRWCLKYKDAATPEAQGLRHHMSGEQHGVSVFFRDGDAILHT